MRSISMVGWVLAQLRAWASRRGESKVFFRAGRVRILPDGKHAQVPIEERYNPPQPEIGL
jgi:hypothetical protein